MLKDPLAKSCCDRHAEMKRERSNFTPLFNELRKLVRPDAADFFSTGASNPGDARKDIYDSTAPWALEQLASGLHSHLSSPVDPWFDITIAGIPHDELDYNARSWLRHVTDVMYSAYADSFGSFAPAIHECYLDIAAFGTGSIYQWYDTTTSTLRFRSFPLADVLVREDATGRVDTVHRTMRLTVRQCQNEFGSLPELLSKMDPSTKVTILHCVYPREDCSGDCLASTKKPWASVYCCEDTCEVLSESGYDSQPYHVARWTKTAGELYGRSPAMSVLPDIRMVNAMSKSMVVAAQKLTDPALQVPDDGFLLPLRSTPGGLNFRRPGADEILPMPGPTNIAVGIDMIEQRREAIRRGFYVDWLVRPVKKERQTAQEITDERNQMLGMLGPVVGRLQSELLGPIVRQSYDLLDRYKVFPPPPPSISGAALDIRYTSPAAKAQNTTRGQGSASFVQQLVQLQPVFPEITDTLDEQGLVAELADLTDVNPRVLARPEIVAEKRQQRQNAQQAAMASQVAPAAQQASMAAKNYAQAQQIAPQLGL